MNHQVDLMQLVDCTLGFGCFLGMEVGRACC